jgi:hypothetical protein
MFETGVQPPKSSIVVESVVLVSASTASALDLWSQNADRSPSLSRLAVLSFGTLMFGLALRGVLLTATGLGRQSATLSSAIAVVGLTLIGPLQVIALTIGLGGALIPLVLIALLLASIRWGEGGKARQLSVMVALILVIVPVGRIALSFDSAPSGLRHPLPVEAAVETATRPDVFVIVLDGYPGVDALVEHFGFDNAAFLRELERQRFSIGVTRFANYTMTYASLAATLSGDYIVPPGLRLGPSERRDLYRITQSGGVAAAWLRDLGYRYVHVESGWGGTRCGPTVDVCVHAPFIDETSWAWLERSALAPVLRRWVGDSFPFDARRQLKALERVNRVQRDGPLFVFVHVLAPHPPALLDSECSVRYRPDLDRQNIGAPYEKSPANEKARRVAFVEQVQCVNTLVLAALESIPNDAITVLMGDHGSDSQGQLLLRTSEWTPAQVLERLSILFAIRVPGGCDVAANEVGSPVNLFSNLSECIGSGGWITRPDRHILVPVEDNHPLDLTREVEMGESSHADSASQIRSWSVLLDRDLTP